MKIQRISLHDFVDFSPGALRVGNQRRGWDCPDKSKELVLIDPIWCQVNLIGAGRGCRLSLELFEHANETVKIKATANAQIGSVVAGEPHDHFSNFREQVLSPGRHTLEAFIDGKHVATRSFEVTVGGSLPKSKKGALAELKRWFRYRLALAGYQGIR